LVINSWPPWKCCCRDHNDALLGKKLHLRNHLATNKQYPWPLLFERRTPLVWVPCWLFHRRFTTWTELELNLYSIDKNLTENEGSIQIYRNCRAKKPIRWLGQFIVNSLSHRMPFPCSIRTWVIFTVIFCKDIIINN